MNKSERRKFIRGLCNNIRDDILSKAKLMPDGWDGIEIRAYIADKAVGCCLVRMDKKRAADYRNTIYTTNL